MLILDIQLKRSTSFDLIEGWLKEGPLPYAVTFVTAHGREEYAVRALRTNALDYISKPIKGEIFHDAMRRMKARVDTRQDVTAQLQSVVRQMLSPHRPPEVLYLTTIDQTTHAIQTNKIVYITSNRGGTTYVYLKNGDRMVANYGIGNFMEMNLPDIFKISQSALVNMTHFKSYNRRNNVLCLHHTEIELAPSRSHQKGLQTFLREGNQSRSASWWPF
jgi:two-component system LytT family response regulator